MKHKLLLAMSIPAICCTAITAISCKDKGEEGSKSNPIKVEAVENATKYSVPSYKSAAHNITKDKEYTYSIKIAKSADSEEAVSLIAFGVTQKDKLFEVDDLDFYDDSVSVTIDDKAIEKGDSTWNISHKSAETAQHFILFNNNFEFKIGSEVKITLKFKASLNNAMAYNSK